MTWVALYQLSGRITLLLFGSVLVWAAIFYVLIQLLHYEPVQTPVPQSRRARLGLPLAFAACGVAALAGALRLPSTAFTSSELTTLGCMSPVMVLCCVLALWNTSFELRNAFRLRRQHRAEWTVVRNRSQSNWTDYYTGQG